MSLSGEIMKTYTSEYPYDSKSMAQARENLQTGIDGILRDEKLTGDHRNMLSKIRTILKEKGDLSLSQLQDLFEIFNNTPNYNNLQQFESELEKMGLISKPKQIFL